MSDIKPIIRRTSVSTVSETVAPQIDQSVIDSFVKIQDPKPAEFTKPTLEEFLLERHKLSSENYTPDLMNIIESMKGYVEAMRIGANPTPEQQGTQVGRLNLTYIRSLRNSDAVLLFDAVLWFFSYYEADVFRAELPFRGIHMHKFATNEQLAFFQHITSIAQEICDIQTRNKRLRELDFRGAIKNVPKTFEKQQAGLTSFIDYYTNF